MTNNAKNIVGITSLIMAVLALIVPYLLFIQWPFTTTKVFPFALPIYCNPIFFILAGVSFVMGLVGWKSGYGKAGFIITTIALGFVMCYWLFILVFMMTHPS